MSTRIYDSRKRTREQIERIEAQKNREIDEVIAKPVKRFNGNGVKRRGDD